METRSQYSQEQDQIRSIAETKGVDIDDIDVIEGETDAGDELVTFRIYETKAETEAESVGVQVSKLPGLQETSDMQFRNDIQDKLNSLKRHLSSETDDTEPVETTDDESDSTDESVDTQSTRARTRTEGDSGDGPGATLDAQLSAIEKRLSEVEDRLDELEEKGEALDGLQQLIDSS